MDASSRDEVWESSCYVSSNSAPHSSAAVAVGDCHLCCLRLMERRKRASKKQRGENENMAAVEEIYVQILFYRTATLARVVQQVTRPNNNLLSSACLRASMRTCLAI